MTWKPISRRTVLRGFGVSLALPVLDAMSSLSLFGSSPAPRPQRAAFLYIPNGVHLENWFPQTEGTDYQLPPTLRPLQAHRAEMTVLGGLDRTFVPGTSVHAQCGACWLSSSPPSEVLDGGFPTNISLDQMISRQIGRETLLPSLELSCNDHQDNRETRYFESISWYGPGYAANVEKNPRAVFRRLFGRPEGNATTRSILDTVRESARDLRVQLGRDDQRKMDEYLDSVRSTEMRIQAAERAAGQRQEPPIPEPEGIPENRGAYIRLMGDLFVLAFQQDLTRVATLLIDPERWDTPRMYHGVFRQPENHHTLTHTRGEEAADKIARIDRFHIEQYSYILGRMKSIREGEGTLLDHSLVVIGSGLSNGNTHSYRDLPVIMAGQAGGRLRTGFYRNFPREVPLANLWLTVAQAFGCRQPRFADSSGPLREILRQS